MNPQGSVALLLILMAAVSPVNADSISENIHRNNYFGVQFVVPEPYVVDAKWETPLLIRGDGSCKVELRKANDASGVKQTVRGLVAMVMSADGPLGGIQTDVIGNSEFKTAKGYQATRFTIRFSCHGDGCGQGYETRAPFDVFTVEVPKPDRPVVLRFGGVDGITIPEDDLLRIIDSVEPWIGDK